ncbi:ABC transporter ATP-binding protein [Sesbania bispinosa]|nr:ABC transporter ATP-binding protein [Sesbania bispinosa]
MVFRGEERGRCCGYGAWVNRGMEEVRAFGRGEHRSEAAVAVQGGGEVGWRCDAARMGAVTPATGRGDRDGDRICV